MGESIKDLTRRFLGQRRPLLAFLHGLVRDADLAEEMLQEVWVRLAEAVEKGHEVRDLLSWCRGTARNLVLHHFRSLRTRGVVADSRLVELAAQAFDEAQASDDRSQWLIDCVEALPEHSRSVLRMKYADGLRAAEIARRQQRTEDAVMKALSRIRQALADCIQQRRAAEVGG
jgi:RNA polymerase sigma-70 factor (ECF subfamily)